MGGKARLHMNFLQDIKKPSWWSSFFIMLFSVIGMGLGVALLKITDMGTDPCSSMNYGVAALLARKTGNTDLWTFGNYQAMFNTVFLIFVILFGRQLIGTGTIGNMFLVGYSADFFTWVLKDLIGVPDHLSLGVRLCILFPALLFFVTVAALYMQSGHGMAPYDGFPFIISGWLEKATGKTYWFKVIRYTLDALATLLGFALGGAAGITTVLMVILLAPAVELAGKFMETHFSHA